MSYGIKKELDLKLRDIIKNTNKSKITETVAPSCLDDYKGGYQNKQKEKGINGNLFYAQCIEKYIPPMEIANIESHIQYGTAS